ncbi:MAG: UDP-glucose/GDP-mannose dehydrogenase family protein [Acidimicrobiaceae bacterium]|nr:UDP-glucose/GDP-mannose dehydrogenase family protein [Ilumatobacter sp.]MCB9379547.1 UDP-glucose/GDP-mannose dehydrogenase family protein [Acidimicrobiaceae bacterium]MCO5331668.1 UDP-glucose/GDP-mannose dehydrogenase family protein [Ilumatobacteraceae bacterium]
MSTSVAVIGTGYVGLTTGACLAHLGHRVTCADIDAAKVAALAEARVPFYEPGLAELVREGVAAGRLRFVLGGAAAVDGADLVFLCVPTPQADDGSADLSYVEAAAGSIAATLRPGAVVVNKSTVPVGSASVVERIIARDDVTVVSNPEFLREGSAVADFLRPDRVIIGTESAEAGRRVAALYHSIDAPVLITDPASAETIKYAANAFLATKISFVNAIAAVCEAVGADIGDVIRGIGSDRRIGPDFLRPGPGWGGSCFPKDTRALVSIAEQGGYDFRLLRGVIASNAEQHDRMVAKVRQALGGSLRGATVAAWGLAFKAGTDDVRDSPAVAIIDVLLAEGATVRAYDPQAVIARQGLVQVGSALAACEGADALVVLTEWSEFLGADLDGVATRLRTPVVVDTRNVLDPPAAAAAGLTLLGVGR